MPYPLATHGTHRGAEHRGTGNEDVTRRGRRAGSRTAEPSRTRRDPHAHHDPKSAGPVGRIRRQQGGSADAATSARGRRRARRPHVAVPTRRRRRSAVAPGVPVEMRVRHAEDHLHQVGRPVGALCAPTVDEVLRDASRPSGASATTPASRPRPGHRRCGRALQTLGAAVRDAVGGESGGGVVDVGSPTTRVWTPSRRAAQRRAGRRRGVPRETGGTAAAARRAAPAPVARPVHRRRPSPARRSCGQAAACPGSRRPGRSRRRWQHRELRRRDQEPQAPVRADAAPMSRTTWPTWWRIRSRA